MVKPEDALKQINRSGYPFQLRVEQQVVSTRSDHGWSVASREHPWAVPDAGSSGFIDIVLQHDHFVTYRLVLECKRIKADDGRQLNWHFLVPDKILKPTALASCFEVESLPQPSTHDAAIASHHVLRMALAYTPVSAGC